MFSIPTVCYPQAITKCNYKQLNFFLVRLLHMPKVAKKYEGIENVSCYKYESHIGKLKHAVQTSHDPCTLMVKDAIQRQETVPMQVEKEPKIETSSPHNTYTDVRKHRCLSVIRQIGDTFLCQEYLTKSELFGEAEYDISSFELGVYVVRKNDISEVRVHKDEFLNMRRALIVDMDDIPELHKPEFVGRYVIMSSFHDIKESMF